MNHRPERSWRGIAIPVVAGLAVAFGVSLAGTASASTQGCSNTGPACGDNQNAFGNGWDVRGQAAVYNNTVISWRNTTSDQATDFIRTGKAPAGPFRYEYAPKGVPSGLCVADPAGGGVSPSDRDGLVLRGCNTGNWQLFRPGAVNGTDGAQLVNVATGKAVTTNGTGAQLTGGGTYTGGSYWKWLGGPVAGSSDMSFTLYANNDSLATCKSGNPVLSPGTASGTSAQVDVVNPPADAPSAAPAFTTDKYNAGDPRWVVALHNGQYLFGTPASAATSSNLSTWTWTDEPSGMVTGTYLTALAAAEAGGSDDWVTAAFIVDDQGGTSLGPVTLTGVQYGGVTYTC